MVREGDNDMKVSLRKLKKNFKTILAYVGLLILSSFAIFPYYYLFVSSIKPKDELSIVPPTLWTWRPTFEAYAKAISQPIFAEALLNTIIVSLASSGIAVFLGILSGYAYSRFNFRGKNKTFQVILLRNMFPGIAFLIPYYAFISWLGWINTYQGLTFTYLVFNLPLAVWLTRGFIDSIPPDFEEQAMVDGCSRLGAMLRIVLPIIRPGIVGIFIYCFANSWIEYAQPLTLWTTKKTLPVALFSIVMGEYQIDWRMLFSMAILMSLPTIIIFYFLQRFIGKALVGGIKM
jgi:ABC-type glycerol-3-phosphate transport system permease component